MTFRDRIKPRWRRMLEPWSLPDEEDMLQSEMRAQAFLDATKFHELPIGPTLEVGCYDGMLCYMLGKEFPVYGSDIATDYPFRRPNYPVLRNAVAQRHRPEDRPEEVYFLDDDICQSLLPDDSFGFASQYPPPLQDPDSKPCPVKAPSP